MRFIFEKRMFFLLILAKSLENAHDLPMTLEFQRSQLYHNKRLQGTTTDHPELFDYDNYTTTRDFRELQLPIYLII